MKQLRYIVYWWIIAALIGACIVYLSRDLFAGMVVSFLVWFFNPDCKDVWENREINDT